MPNGKVSARIAILFLFLFLLLVSGAMGSPGAPGDDPAPSRGARCFSVLPAFALGLWRRPGGAGGKGDGTSPEGACPRCRELDEVLAAIPDIIFVLDGEANLRGWNVALETATDRDPASLVGKPALSLVEEADRPAVTQAIRRCMDEGKAEVEGRILDSRGGSSTYLIKGVPLRDAKGDVTGIAGVARDIGAWKSLEEEKSKLVALVENSTDIVGICTLEGRVLYVNRAGLETMGFSDLEEARKTHLVDYVPEKHRDRFREVLARLPESGRWQVEGRIRHYRTGRSIPVEINSFVIPDPRTGRPKYLANVTRDITAKRKMEAELLKTQKLESIGLLAGGIAHDFNNILTSVLGHIALARTGLPPGDKAFARLQEAEKATLRAKDLTQQLLTFSEGGAPVRRTASIASLIRESALVSLRGTGSRCDFEIPADLWSVEVDEGQIGRVVHNLVVNAHEAMPGGGTIRIRCENVDMGKEGAPSAGPGQGCYVRISVNDHGAGIPEGLIPRVFDPYFTTKKGASGLGLAAAFSIVKKHDGHIGVASRPGEGSTFFVHLPVSAGPPAPAREAPAPSARSAAKVLVMDDDEHVRQVAAEMLELLGHTAETARNGEEALTLYEVARRAGAPFDMVVMDLTVSGGMGGREAMRRLKAIDPAVIGIVSSGYSNDPVMGNYREFGFSGIVRKPYGIPQLRTAVLEAMALRKSRDSG